MNTQLLGVALVVVGLILAVPNARSMLRLRKQGRKPRTILLAYWDMIAGIEVFLLGIIFFIDYLFSSLAWRPYILVARLLLIGAIALAGLQRLREVRRREKTMAEIRLLSDQMSRKGESADLLNDLGYSYREIGELDKAKEVLKHALSIDSDKALIHTNLGNVYFDLGLYQQALAEYKKAKKIEPDEIGIENNIQIVQNYLAKK